ncbi:MAG: DUF1573 domain-containing protein [Rikenellaceae bacterium]
MKRLFLTFTLTLIGVMCFAQGAIIEADSATHNFGRVTRKGADVEHTFTIRNSGTTPLVITEASTTCTCIKVKYPKRPIPPQGSAEVNVRYEVQRKEVGPFHKIIKILSNSSNGDQMLTIHGISVEK